MYATPTHSVRAVQRTRRPQSAAVGGQYAALVVGIAACTPLFLLDPADLTRLVCPMHALLFRVDKERSVGKVGDNGGGRRSWFRTRRWRRRGEKQHPDDTTTMQRKPVEGAIRIDVGAGRGTTIEAVHEEGPKIPQSSGTIQAIGKPSTAATAATAAVAAAAVRDDLAGVDKGEIVSDSDHRVGGPAVRGRDVAPRPAEYDGEEVLPETWAKVSRELKRGTVGTLVVVPSSRTSSQVPSDLRMGDQLGAALPR